MGSMGKAQQAEDLAGRNGKITIWGCCCCCCCCVGARFWVAEESPKALRGFIEKTMLADEIVEIKRYFLKKVRPRKTVGLTGLLQQTRNSAFF